MSLHCYKFFLSHNFRTFYHDNVLLLYATNRKYRFHRIVHGSELLKMTSHFFQISHLCKYYHGSFVIYFVS